MPDQFFKTGSSYISTVNRVIQTKFGLLTDFGLYNLQESDVTQSETGSKIAPPLLPCWKSIKRHCWTKKNSLSDDLVN